MKLVLLLAAAVGWRIAIATGASCIGYTAIRCAAPTMKARNMSREQVISDVRLRTFSQTFDNACSTASQIPRLMGRLPRCGRYSFGRSISRVVTCGSLP